MLPQAVGASVRGSWEGRGRDLQTIVVCSCCREASQAIISLASECVWGGWKYSGPNLKCHLKFYTQLLTVKSIFISLFTNLQWLPVFQELDHGKQAKISSRCPFKMYQVPYSPGPTATRQDQMWTWAWTRTQWTRWNRTQIQQQNHGPISCDASRVRHFRLHFFRYVAKCGTLTFYPSRTKTNTFNLINSLKLFFGLKRNAKRSHFPPSRTKTNRNGAP
jgi:hypothetical protein